MAKEERRTLGSDTIPVNYSITFEPNMKTFRYKGFEGIELTIRKRTRQIRLNCNSVKIREAYISCKKRMQKARVKYLKGRQEVVLSFKEPIVGSGELRIEFGGVNDESLRGFYRSKYVDRGNTGYILTTHFEASDARKAFPCFDEPGLKATFEVSFKIPRELSAVSNMPIKSEKRIDKNLKIVAFRKTPRMSSYLLYLGVGKFEFKTRKPKGLPVLRVVNVPGKSGKSTLALDMCEHFLRFYNNYFGIRYPLPKLDLLAIPDFPASAMENWGAITFREVALLGDMKSSSVMTLQMIAEVIAHELGHQWFGDLVTMKWWDDLWLNESFATYMSIKAVEAAYPKWQFGLQSEVNKLSMAFSADQFTSTHPINVRVNNPDEISEIFDEISYDKGGSVIGMLEDYTGSGAFRKGLHNYLKKHSYSNATKEDLWKSIQGAATGNDRKTQFVKVARSWIDKAGYPIVSIKNMGNRELLLEQRRFLMLMDSNLDDTWPIPIHYLTAGGRDNFMLMGRKSARIRLKDSTYIKMNYGQKGLYRVNYPGELLHAIGSEMASGRMPPIDSWGVEKDLYTFARTSRIRVKDYLDFVESYCIYAEYPLDQNVSGHLAGLDMLLSENPSLHERVSAQNINYHKMTLERLTWVESKEEKNVTKILRSSAISNLGRSDYEPVIIKAREMFDSYVKEGKMINKDIRSAVYSVVAWNGDMDTYNRFISLFKKESNPEEQRRLLQSIGGFRDEGIAARALDFSISKDVRLQDSIFVAVVTSRSLTGKKILWNWIKRNWKTLMKRYTAGTSFLETYLESNALVDDPAVKEDMRKFYSNKKNMRGDIKRSVKKMLELIDVNIRFREFNGI